MKERLVVLSDLWGVRDDSYLNEYSDLLDDTFDVVVYDSSQLAQVPPELKEQEQIHQAFINGGIEIAIQHLLKLETAPPFLLGFSIGGVLAWQHALQQTSVKALFAVSATRLRYEQQKPNCPINLYYGALDDYKPDQAWFEHMQLSANMQEDHGHDLYQEAAFINQICGIIRQLI